MSSITASFYTTSELIHFFSMQENDINLLRSSSSGNPSVLSVITGVLKHKHPFCLNSWISKCFSLELPLSDNASDAHSRFSMLMPLDDIWRAIDSVSGSLFFGPSSWFWKPRWISALHHKLHTQWTSNCPNFSLNRLNNKWYKRRFVSLSLVTI